MSCSSASFFARIARYAGIKVLDSISAGNSINSQEFYKEFKVCNKKRNYSK